MKKRHLLIIPLTWIAGARHACAQITYSGPVDGDYATAANWTGGTIPGDGNANGATIGNGATQSVIYSTATNYTSTGTGAANRLIVGGGANGDGTLTLNGSAGTLTFGGDGYGNAAWIGSTGGTSSPTTGVVNINAGKLAITGGADASINLGVNINGAAGVRTGTININGGTLEVGRRILMGANNGGNVASLTLTSGTLDMKRTGSGSENDLGFIRFGAGTCTVNLDGGTALVSGFRISDFVNLASNIYFNGTTLKANADNGDYIVGSPANAGLRMKSGGLVFDTNGFSVTINDGMTEEAGHTAIVRKEGSGTLVLSAATTRTGLTTVNAGTLRSGSASLGSGNAVVNNGAILDLSGNDAWGNHTATVTQLTIASGGLVTNGTAVNVGFNGMQSLVINGGELRVTGSARAIADGDLRKFEAYGIRDSVTTGGSAASLISNPTDIANAGINIGGVTDNGGGEGDDITFNVADATGNASADLTVSAVLKNNYTLFPALVPLSNGLVKTGAGTLVLDSVNRYTGDTTISQGLLHLADDAELRIKVGDSTSNRVTGAGTAQLDGDLYLDLANANPVVTKSWTIVDVSAPLYGGTFSIKSSAGNFTNSSGVWTLSEGGRTWTFKQSTGLLELVVPDAGYDGWIGSFSGLADITPGGDADFDGIKNLLEYVLNGHPGASSPEVLPVLTLNPTEFVFSFTRREESSGDTSQIFEYSSDLSDWTPVNITGDTGSEVTVGPPTDGLQSVTVTIPKSATTTGKLFGRLKVETP